MRYVGFSEITNGMREDAAYIAHQRDERNRGNPDPYYRREGIEKRVGELGVLAELAVRRSLDLSGIPYCVSPLLDVKPVVSPDIRIDSISFDVKGTSNPNKVYVNERAHNKKVCDGYLFAWVDGDLCRIYAVPYFSVSLWALEKLAFTPAYCYNRVLEACPLESLWRTLDKSQFESF